MVPIRDCLKMKDRPVPGYNLLDLGPVTFTETGNHIFQFQVSGRDAK